MQAINSPGSEWTKKMTLRPVRRWLVIILSAAFLAGSIFASGDKKLWSLIWSVFGLSGLASVFVLQQIVLSEEFLTIRTRFGDLSFHVSKVEVHRELFDYLKLSILDHKIILFSIIFFYFLTPAWRGVYIGSMFLRRIDDGSFV